MLCQMCKIVEALCTCILMYFSTEYKTNIHGITEVLWLTSCANFKNDSFPFVLPTINAAKPVKHSRLCSLGLAHRKEKFSNEYKTSMHVNVEA